MQPTTISSGSKYYKKLSAVAAMLEAVSPHDATYLVGDTYFDMGQKWMWTTIIRRGYRDCQVLDPKQWEHILEANTPDDLAKVTNDIISDEYFSDK